MKTERIEITGIPAILWGEKKNRLFIAVHGNMSNKEDTVIKILAEILASKGYQLLSFDLPEHGERKDNFKYICNVQNCVKDLEIIMKYAKDNYREINLWACSMGAYFSLVAFNEEHLNQCLFLSPIVNMKTIIDSMMILSNVTEEELKIKGEIKTDFGQTLYWNYYEYVNNNPITNWEKETYILYGNKDNMQNEDLITDFCNKFDCKLEILENGEHYFHSEEQLKYYKDWLDKIIK